MAKVYCDLIHAGLRTFEQVPAPWKAQVEVLLANEDVV